MRAEEELAKDAVCEWLNCNAGYYPQQIVPEPFGQATAPDYSIDFEDREIYLEITLSGMGFLIMPQTVKTVDSNQKINGHDRIKYELSAVDFLKKQYNAESKTGNEWIKPGESLMVYILSPIPLKNRGKLGQKLLKILKELYQKSEIHNLKNSKSFNDGEFTMLTGDIDLPGITLHVSITDFYQNFPAYAPIMVEFFAPQSSINMPYDASLDNQSIYILESIINKKTKKCEHLKNEIWLVILNEHPLLGIEEYENIIPDIIDIIKKSKFSKIFIVDSGNAHALYEKNHT